MIFLGLSFFWLSPFFSMQGAQPQEILFGGFRMSYLYILDAASSFASDYITTQFGYWTSVEGNYLLCNPDEEPEIREILWNEGLIR